MTGLIPVMIGGALGAGARYAIGALAGSPWATLAVNLTGGFVMGLLIGVIERAGAGGAESWRLFAGVGVLGGFTTFSAFGLESWQMLERGQYPMAALYVMCSVAGAILLTGLGLWIARP